MAAFFLLAFGSALHDSVTYDEPLHLTSGYVTWTRGLFGLEPSNPSLIGQWISFPLLAMRPDLPKVTPTRDIRYRYSFKFVFRNRMNPHRLILAGRVMIILMGVGLGYLLSRWAGELFGSIGAVAALTAYVFCPPVLAHAHLATIDLGNAFFCTLALYVLYKWSKSGSFWTLLSAGAACGAALAVKYSALSLLPCIFLSIILSGRRRSLSALDIARIFGLFCLVVLFLVAACYRFVGWRAWFEGLRYVFQEMDQGYPTFLASRYSQTGWRSYFLIAYLLKTPLPFLAAVMAGVVLLIHGRYPKARIVVEFVVIPGLWFMVLASFSHAQRGVRHILPIYPLQCLWIGGTVQTFWDSKRFWLRGICLVAVLLYAGETLWYFPRYISYFNQWAGGPTGGYRYLLDSNTDWGQGLRSLGRYMQQEHVELVDLSYFGCADPTAYGIHYRPVASVTCVELPGLAAGAVSSSRRLLAISVSNLMGLYYQPHDAFAWLRPLKPVQILDDSIFVYDLTGQEEFIGRIDAIVARHR